MGLFSGLGGLAQAAQLDAAGYVLSYDDGLGTPTVTRVAGITTYTFPSFTMLAEYFDLGQVSVFPAPATFSARLDTAAGTRFKVRPDASFPIWATVNVSELVAFPDVPADPPEVRFPDVSQSSESSIWGEVSVNSAAAIDVGSLRAADMRGPAFVPPPEDRNVGVPGGSSSIALVSFTARVQANPATYNLYYCPGCQYVGPGEPFPDPVLMFSYPGDIHVEGRFTPMLVVDERFVTAVPEPLTCAMLLFGLGFIGLAKRAARGNSLRAGNPARHAPALTGEQSMRWCQHAFMACMVAGSLSSLAAHGATHDRGIYSLTFDDALGTPAIGTSGNLTTISFPEFSWVEEGYVRRLWDFRETRIFEIGLSAGAGLAFYVRPDGSFPVWASVEVAHLDAVPLAPSNTLVEVEPPRGGIDGFSMVTAQTLSMDNRYWASLAMRAPAEQWRVNAVIGGSLATQASVTLQVGLTAYGGIYRDNCELAEGVCRDPYQPMTYYPEIRVSGSFQPKVFIDDSFVRAVPEPTTQALLFAGLAVTGIAAARRTIGQSY